MRTGKAVVVAAAASMLPGSGVVIGTAAGSGTLIPQLVADDVVKPGRAAAAWVLEEWRHEFARAH